MIPAELYNFYFNNVMLFVLSLTFFVYSQSSEKLASMEGYNRFNFWLITSLITLFLGTRPVSGAFVDMPGYESGFNLAAATGEAGYSDWLFNVLTVFIAKNFSASVYFFVIAGIYIVSLAWAARRVHHGWGLALNLAFMSAFSFFAYGVNGIRNGAALSLVILAISFSDRRLIMALIMLAAYGMHGSTALPIAAFLASTLYARVGLATVGWMVCLIANLAVGEQLAPLVAGLIDFSEDQRLVNYATSTGMDRGGFRWDFILYSIVPVVVSYCFADEATKRETFYRRILSTYLLCNAFWLLVMYASQSNRIAYLSWFLMPWVVFYPMIPVSKFADVFKGGVHKVPRTSLLGLALLVHMGFTYVMNVFVYSGRNL